MAVEQVHAFKTSDGRCFASKSEAYQEERLELYRRLPAREGRQNSMKDFRKCIVEMKEWLAAAESLVRQVDSEPDAEIRQRVKVQE